MQKTYRCTNGVDASWLCIIKKDTQSDTQQATVTTSMEQLNSKNEADIIDDNYRTCYEVLYTAFMIVMMME